MDITYNTFSVDHATLPEQSIKVLLSRGLTHLLGNEQAAKVSAARKRADEDGKPLTEMEATDLLAKFRSDAFTALQAGTLGVRESSGPRITPLDRRVRESAKAELFVKLQANGVKVPKKMDVAFYPPGAPVDSISSLIDKWTAKHGERLTKEAEAAIKAEERRMAKIRESADGLDLGLD